MENLLDLPLGLFLKGGSDIIHPIGLLGVLNEIYTWHNIRHTVNDPGMKGNKSKIKSKFKKNSWYELGCQWMFAEPMKTKGGKGGGIKPSTLSF